MSETKRLLITVVLVVVVVLAEIAGLYFILARVGGIFFTPDDSLTAEIQRLETDIQAERERAAQIPGFLAAEAQLQPVLGESMQLVPMHSPTDTLVRYIRQKAEEAGLRVTLVRPSRVGGETGGPPVFFGPQNAQAEQPQGPSYDEWNYQIRVHGSFDAIASFINLMEEFEIRTPTGQTVSRFFAVKQIEMTVPESGLEPGRDLTCELVMRTFRYTGEAPEENA
jgi:Tfp pilus assembly protein PilO